MSQEYKDRMIEINRTTKEAMIKSSLFVRFHLAFEIYKFKKAIWAESPNWLKKYFSKPVFEPYRDMFQKVLN